MYSGSLSDLITVDRLKNKVHSNRHVSGTKKNNNSDMETMEFHNILIAILIDITEDSHS